MQASKFSSIKFLCLSGVSCILHWRLKIMFFFIGNLVFTWKIKQKILELWLGSMKDLSSTNLLVETLLNQQKVLEKCVFRHERWQNEEKKNWKAVRILLQKWWIVADLCFLLKEVFLRVVSLVLSYPHLHKR